MAASSLWLHTFLAFIFFFTFAASIDDKCAACYAVAEELEHVLANEKPRNHLDLRNRLDSKGQRRGKVIDYRVSELRAVEFLDGLCEKMQDYTLQEIDSKKQEWIKVKSWENLTVSKLEARAHSKAISSYCGRLLEETEDELVELIKKRGLLNLELWARYYARILANTAEKLVVYERKMTVMMMMIQMMSFEALRFQVL